MLAKIKDTHAVGGYRMLSVTGFYRTENNGPDDGTREYVLVLADGGEVKQVLNRPEWEELERSQLVYKDFNPHPRKWP